jgi:hypothetical protein
MPGKAPWFDRKFSFDFPVGIYPDLIERLRGTPGRAEETAGGLADDVLTRRHGDSWSIQENLGHLTDLEPLMAGRIDDFLAGAAVLRAADLTNRTTHEAGHNHRPIGEVLREFRRARLATIARLESLADSDFARTSLHPRLKQPMRLVDSMYFQAAHDDYHLARVSELKRLAARAHENAPR